MADTETKTPTRRVMRQATQTGTPQRGRPWLTSFGSWMRGVLLAVGFAGAAGVMPLAGVGTASAAEPAPAPAKPDPNKAQKIVADVCAACHGSDGNSTSTTIPKLAGQHYDYLVKQLENFKSKDGKPPERASAIMGPMVMTLSEDDMRNLAAYYASQKLKPAVARDKETAALGQQIYRGGIAAKSVPACAGCHSPNGAGIPAQYPHIAGQNTDYTLAQLTAFRAGARRNSQPMMDIASRLSDDEIKAVSDYIAGLR